MVDFLPSRLTYTALAMLSQCRLHLQSMPQTLTLSSTLVPGPTISSLDLKNSHLTSSLLQSSCHSAARYLTPVIRSHPSQTAPLTGPSHQTQNPNTLQWITRLHRILITVTFLTLTHSSVPSVLTTLIFQKLLKILCTLPPQSLCPCCWLSPSSLGNLL